MKAISFLLFACCVLLAGLFGSTICMSLQAQDSFPDTADIRMDNITFTEIQLTPEGVTAVDTTGHAWFYDFGQGTFAQNAASVPESDEDAGFDRPDLPEDEVAVEIRCTEKLELKAFEQTVLVGYDEYVDGDIVAYGRVTVKGWVRGSVKSIQNRVLVSESGRVDGDIEAPRVIIKSGGDVLGTVTETGNPLDLKNINVPFSVDGLIIVTSISATFLLFGFLISTLMPKQLASMTECIGRYRVRSILLGIMLVFLLPIVMAVVAITVVGVVLLPLVPLLYLVGFWFGAAAVGRLVGRKILSRYLTGRQSTLAESMTGMLPFIALWYLTAVLLGSSDPVAEGFGIAALVISIIVSAYPLTAGVGAMVLTRVGLRHYQAWRERQVRAGDDTGMPAPPPIPEAPSPPPKSWGPVRSDDGQTEKERRGGTDK